MNTAVPESAGSRRIKIRDNPCSFWGFRASTVVQRSSRRWQNGSYTDEPGPVKHGQTRQQHGINTAPTRMTTDRPGQSTAVRRTNTAETRTAPNGHGPTRRLHGPPRVLPSSRTVRDVHGSFELPKTAVLASRNPKDLPGHSRINRDRRGPSRRLHGSHARSCRM